jgi:hypothetical protein
MTTESVYYCARHPNTETLLACGRCETFICPRCAVFTDVGARCPDCAPRRKLPQLEVGPVYALRAAAATAFAAGIIGAAWGILLPGGFGFFSVFLGIGIGWVIVTAITLATNKKLGPVMQTIGILGVVGAFLVRNVVAGYGIIPADDIGGLFALAAGVIYVISQLRY